MGESPMRTCAWPSALCSSDGRTREGPEPLPPRRDHSTLQPARMRPALARFLTLWVAATLALLLPPVRSARAAEHAGLERTHDVELAANSPRRSTLSERGLERPTDDASSDDLGVLDPRRAPLRLLLDRALEGHAELRRHASRFASFANARGPPHR
jgi:hypothetical protein